MNKEREKRKEKRKKKREKGVRRKEEIEKNQL